MCFQFVAANLAQGVETEQVKRMPINIKIIIVKCWCFALMFDEGLNYTI